MLVFAETLTGSSHHRIAGGNYLPSVGSGTASTLSELGFMGDLERK